MSRPIPRRPAYANVMATIAVFVALGGSAFAAGYVITKSSQIKDGVVTGADVKNSSLTAGDLKNSSLTGNDVANRSLTGADIDLAQLGKVPSAANADGAATAANAVTADRARVSDQVDGQHVERVAAKISPGASAAAVGVDGGLQITAECTQAGELRLFVGSSTAGALVHASVVNAFAGPANVTTADDPDLNPGERLTLVDAHGHGTAQVAYLGADGRVSTAVIGFGELSGPQTCTIIGTVVRAG